jgi:transposase
MIRREFLSATERKELLSLARDGSAEHRIARRANAVLLLDDGLSCERVAEVLYLDDDTVRGWRKLYEERGIAGLEQFDAGGSSSRLSAVQEQALKAYVAQTLPRSTREIGAFIEREFGIVYESRSGLIALLHRLGLEYHKPEVIGRKLDTEKQRAFIEAYEKLLNSLGPDEAVLFLDAVHPTHAARPVGCWAPKEEKLAIEQTSGRQRINIHGAIDLETGQTRMIEAETIDAASTIKLLEAIEALYPLLAMIHPTGQARGHDLPGQCPVSSRQAGASLAGPAGPQDQIALRPGLLPAPEPHRAIMGRDAQACDAQQVLRHIAGVRRGSTHFLTRDSPGKLGGSVRFGHG